MQLPPHCPGTPAPPQVSGDVHVPHCSKLPQPSAAGPQVMLWSWQVLGVQVGGLGGPTQEAKSQIMNSRIFSCAVIGPLSHSLGNTTAGVVT